MKRLIGVLAASLAVLAGTARADVFVVVPSGGAPVLASADVPNAPGTVLAPSLYPSATGASLPYAELQSLWQRAGSAYGIPWQVLASINKVESNFGRNMGPSSAGAIGWMQFMPSTWERWGLDANGDGVADPWNAEDAIFAAARYLAAAGGRADLPRAIFAYNHAQWYVDEVLRYAALFGDLGVDATFFLDRLQVRLGAAERRVARLNRRMLGAIRTQQALDSRARAARERTDHAALLSDRLAAQQRAVQLGARSDAAAAGVSRLRLELKRAKAALDAARSRSRETAFAPAAGTLFGAPSFSGDYVFPVGGGPGLVSVGHTHHDYPAADIAAPEGSPLYALANGTVLEAWSLPDARCGIGFTMQSADGLTWTYCHLAYLDPNVLSGAALFAGQSVGLVGATGDATGPHLHLQLQPPTEYPQSLPWFQAFAGTAFRWQDAAPSSVYQVISADPGPGIILFSS